MGHGRRKFTPELGQKIANLIAKGYMIGDACTACGIHRQTYYNWLKLAKKSDDKELKDFAWAIAQARVEDKARAENVLRDLAYGTEEESPNFHALRYLLTHKYPKDWGDLDNQKIKENTQRVLEIIKENVDPEKFNSICAQLGESYERESEDILSDATLPEV